MWQPKSCVTVKKNSEMWRGKSRTLRGYFTPLLSGKWDWRQHCELNASRMLVKTARWSIFRRKTSPRICRKRSGLDRKSTRLNSSHSQISYAVFCLKKKKENQKHHHAP